MNTRSSLGVDLVLLRITGLYARHRNIWTYIRCSLSILGVLAILFLFVLHSLDSYGNLMEFTTCLLYIIGAVCVICKAFVSLANGDKFRILEESLENPILFEYSEESDIIMKDTTNSKFLTTLRIFGLWVCTLLALSAFYQINGRHTIFPVRIIGDLSDDRVYYFYAAVQSLYVFPSGINFLTVDILCSRYINIATGTIKILEDKLRRIPFDSNNLELKQYMKHIVRYHNEIFKFISSIEDAFSVIILAVFLGSVSMMCLIYYVILTAEMEFAGRVYFVVYLVYISCQMSIYCWYGEQITTQSDKLGDILFMTRWHETDPSIKKYFILFLERTHRPNILTAGKIFPINLATLAKLFRSSYSYFAVLQNAMSK